MKLPSRPEASEELKRRKSGVLFPVDGLFKAQRVFNADEARYKAALNTRRSGKSHLAAARLLNAALEVPCMCPYIALTRESARRIMWPTLLELNDKYKLGADPQESSLTFKVGKSEIFLVGADQKNFMRKLLGGKYRRAVIDEAQAFGDHLEAMIDDVLTPTLVDLNGDLDLYGTPGLRPSGFFYDITTGAKQGFSVHKWSILDNPFIPNAQKFIDEMMANKGWTVDNPTYRREWLGEWVLDLDALLFKFNKIKNTYSEKPKGPAWDRVLGIDYGWHDETAFVVLCYSDQHPHIFVEHAESYSEMIPSMVAKKVHDLIEIYSPVHIVADTGGLGKSITEEMKQRYQLPIEAAEKSEKATNISNLNGDLIDGKLFINARLTDLIHELENIPRGDRMIEADGAKCDLADAFLYAYKKARHYTFQQSAAILSQHSEEYILERIEEEAKAKQNEDWWERDSQS